MNFIKVERGDDGVVVLTVDRQDKLNSLNPQVVEEIGQALLELQEDPPRVIIAELGHAATALLDRSPVPTIAAINGFALGGGCEIALACDIRIAAENALLGFPEVTLGILPGLGGTQRLPRLVGPGIAKEMIFSGRRLKAEEARMINLVNRVVPEGEALNAARELAGEIASNGPVAVRHAKAAANKSQDVDLVSGLEYEADQFALLFATEDAREGMGAFVEKRKADFKGR
jgi:enoyl-CoA hydratase